MQGKRLLGHIAIVVLATALSWGLTGVARADTEPNNEIIEAEGPLSAQTYTGSIQTEQDEDWYWVQLGSQQQVTFKVEELPSASCHTIVSFQLLDYWGNKITQLDPWYQEPDEEEYHYTTAVGGGIYYIKAFGLNAAGCGYGFSITPSSGYAPASPKPPVVAVPEPNELQVQAYGPLASGVLYAGAIETQNDVDQLYFDGRAHRTVTFQLTLGSCGYERDGVIRAEFAPLGGEPIDEDFGLYEANTRANFSVKVSTRATIYYVKLTGSECRWQAEVSPPESLLSSLPSSGSRNNACVIDKRLLGRRRARLHRAERTLRFTHDRGARGRLHHKIEARRRAVRAARHAVHVHCTRFSRKAGSD